MERGLEKVCLNVFILHVKNLVVWGEIPLCGSVHKELGEDNTVILTANCPPKFTEAKGPLEVIFS